MATKSKPRCQVLQMFIVCLVDQQGRDGDVSIKEQMDIRVFVMLAELHAIVDAISRCTVVTW